MQITEKAWVEYITKMSQISQKAADLMQSWVQKNGLENDKALLDYAYALSQHYGQAIGALSCQMYEATAAAQGVIVPTAEVADLPDYGEVAKAVKGTKKQSPNNIPGTLARLVKQVGADTTLKNAERDGAQFAWVPHGDTCAFCITLASRGWQYMSKNKDVINARKRELYASKKAEKLEKLRRSDILISGARITDLNSAEADEFAEMYYEEIRHFSTDSKKIADNLGKEESDIRKIKAYLFEDDSLIDPDTGESRKFDPDCAIAQSWQRLMNGKDIKLHDKTLIEHELLEMKIKQENPGIDHVKAHELASEKYNYSKEALEYYGNLKKHKKSQ